MGRRHCAIFRAGNVIHQGLSFRPRPRAQRGGGGGINLETMPSAEGGRTPVKDANDSYSETASWTSVHSA